MMRRRSVIAILLVAVISVFGPYQPKAIAQASPPKEFITSVTYGVLAGTLMGIASLAFTSNPGDNLNKIARGASLGLYLGIALGFYVTYGVSDEAPEDMVNYPYHFREKRIKESSLLVYPLIDEKGLEGMAGLWQVTSF